MAGTITDTALDERKKRRVKYPGFQRELNPETQALLSELSRQIKYWPAMRLFEAAWLWPVEWHYDHLVGRDGKTYALP